MDDLKNNKQTLKFQNDVVPLLEKSVRLVLWHTQQLILNRHYVGQNDDTDYIDIYDTTNFNYIGRAISSRFLENILVKKYRKEFEDGRLAVEQTSFPIENTSFYLERMRYTFYAPEEFTLRDEKTGLTEVLPFLESFVFCRITDNCHNTITKNKQDWCTYTTYLQCEYKPYEVDEILKKIK